MQAEQVTSTESATGNREKGSGHEAQPIRVKLTAEDYAEFNLYHGRLQLAGLFLFYWCLFVIAARLTELAATPSEMAIAISGSFVLSGLLLAYQLWRIKVRTVRLFENDKTVKLEQHIVLEAAGIRHTTENTTVQVAWNDVYRAAETAKAIIIYLAKNKVIMLPKRDIRDLGQIRQILRQQLPAAKLKLKS
jgi:hypothetical protein